ncbi:Abi family protein [Pseudomonadota bacterium AL_CKDN230030165-1A_HGKHYDSX7]
MATAVPRQPFRKPALPAQALLIKLKRQGLSVADDAQALTYLEGVGGYRLKGYWHHAIDASTKRFKPGFDFEHIRQNCELDREVRAATIQAIERLEVAIRAVMANHLSLRHSPHWYLDHRIFKPTRDWGIGQLIRKVESETLRSHSSFIKHYFTHHDDPYLPPSWAISECVSFGMWSQTYAILRDVNDKKAIAMRFGVSVPDVFESWIHTLAVVRNTSAHHGQLLRVQLRVNPAQYKRAGIVFAQPKSFFAAATVIQYLLQQTQLPHHWKSSLGEIFHRYPRVPPSDLGFLPGWQASPGW